MTAQPHNNEFTFDSLLFKSSSTSNTPYTSILLTTTPLPSFYAHLTSTNTSTTAIKQTLSTFHSIINTYPHLIHTFVPVNNKHYFYNTFISLYLAHVSSDKEIVTIITNILSLSLEHLAPCKQTYEHLYKEIYSFNSITTYYDDIIALVRLFYINNTNTSINDRNSYNSSGGRGSCNSSGNRNSYNRNSYNSNRNSCNVSNIKMSKLKNYIVHNSNSHINVINVLQNKKLSLSSPLNFFIWFSITEQGNVITSQYTSSSSNPHSLIHIELSQNKSISLKLNETYTALNIQYNDNNTITKSTNISQNTPIKPFNWYMVHLYLSSPSFFSNDSFIKLFTTYPTYTEFKTAIPFQRNFLPINSLDILNITFYNNFYGLSTSIFVISEKIGDISFNHKSKSTLLPYGPNTHNEIKLFINTLLQYNKNILDNIALAYTPLKAFQTCNEFILDNAYHQTQMKKNSGVVIEQQHDVASATSCLSHLHFKYTNVCNLYSPYRRIYNIGGSCCMLLLFEKMCANTSENITSDIFEKTLSLISDVILLSKYNFVCALKENMFYYLGAYLDKIPSQYYNETIFDIVIKWKDFYITHYTFFQQWLLPYNKQFRSFTKYILLNYNILFKFKDKQYKTIWEHITALMNANTVEFIIKDIAIDKLLRYLLTVDKQRYSTYCCMLHHKAVASKKENGTVNNINYYIQPVQPALIEVIKYDIEHNECSIIKMLSLLSLDLSPCLQKFIIATFILFINNVKLLPEQFEMFRNNLTTNDNYIKDILLYVLTVSLPDVRSELVFLITLLTDKFPTMFGTRSKMFIKDNILAGIVKVNYAIRDVDSSSSTPSSSSTSNVNANLKNKFQYYKKYLNTYLESNDDFNMTHIKINIGSKVTFADFPTLTEDYMFNSINKMYTYLLNWLNYCVNDAQYIRDIDRYNNSNQIFAILIGFISKLNEPNMIVLFLQDINTFINQMTDKRVIYFKIILHSKEFLHFLLENYLHFSLPNTASSSSQTNSQISSLCYSTLVTFITNTLNIDPQSMLLCYLVQWCHYHSIISNQTVITLIAEFVSSLFTDILSNETLMLKSIDNTKYTDNTNFQLTLFSNIFLEITALFHLQQQIIEEPTIFIQNQFPSYTYVSLSRKLPTYIINLISLYLKLTKSLWNIHSYCGYSSLKRVITNNRNASYVSKKDIADALIEQYIKPRVPLCSFEEAMLQLTYCFRFAKNINICTAQSKSHVNNKTFYQPISMMKIMLHLFITKLEFAETIEQLNETLDQFENYVMFIIIASTNLGFGLKKETRIANKSELQIIQETSFQVLVYSLYYILNHYYLNEDKRVKYLYGECFDFLIGMMYNVIDKGSIKYFVNAPLYKMFYDVFKVTEVDDKGEMVIEPHEIDYIGFMEVFGKENNLVWNKVLFNNKEFVKGIVDKVFERKVVMTNALFYFCEIRNIVPLHAITEVNEDKVDVIQNVGIKLGNNYVNVDCEYIANRIQDNLIECVNDIKFTLMVKEFNKTFMKDRLRKGYVKMKERLLKSIGVYNAYTNDNTSCKLKMRNHYSTQMTPFLVKQRSTLNDQLLPPLLSENNTITAITCNDNSNNYLKEIYMKCYKGIIWENISRLNINSIDNIKHLYKCIQLKDFTKSTGLLYTRQNHLIYISSENRVRELKPINLISKKLSLSYKSILFIFTKKINNYEGIEIFTSNNKFYSFLLLHGTAKSVIDSIHKIYPYFFIKHLSETIQNLICYINLNFDYNGTNFILKNVNTLYYHWCEHSITTFELLNWLNIMAGRSWYHYELYPYIPYPLMYNTEHEKKIIPKVFHKETFTLTFSESLSLKDSSVININSSFSTESFTRESYNTTNHTVDSVNTQHKLMNLTKDEISFWLHKIIYGDNTNINMISFKDLKSIDVVPPQIVSIPELLSESILPMWCNKHKYVFSLEIRKYLERSNSMHKWVEFIYGQNKDNNKYKQHYSRQRSYSFDGEHSNEIITTSLQACSCIQNRALFNESNLEQRNTMECKYISNKGNIMSHYVKKKSLIQTQGTSLLYISYNIYTNNFEAITNTYKLITFKAKIKDSIATVFDEKLIKIPHKTDEILFNGHNSNINTNCLGKKQSVVINEYLILSGFWDKSLLVLNVFDNTKSFTIKNKYDNSSITYIDKDKYNTMIYLVTHKGSLLVYKVTKIQSNMKLDFHLGRHDHNTQITSLLVNNTLQVIVTSSYDGTVNIYSYPLIKHINSIQCESNFNISNVIISSCPLPVIVVYSYDKKRFIVFTINGTELACKDNTSHESDHWISFAKYRGEAFQEYLLLGSDKGVFELRKFPELQVKHRLFVSERNYAVNEIVPVIIHNNYGSVLLCLEQNKEIVLLDNIIK